MEGKTLGSYIQLMAGAETNLTILSQLHSKYADKQWNETIQLVRRCMEKSKNDSSFSHLYLRCLERLHEALNVLSLTAMVSRLEMIAKQRGLGSHRSPTETTCYVTSDMFYVEVLLLPGGGVEDVKVAHHGEAPVSQVELLTLLRSKRFEDFSVKLDCLSSLYNIQGDSETKMKVYTALQHLEEDLVKISQLPRPVIDHDLHVDTILNGRIGKITLRKEGNPLSIKYYISPYDQLTENADAECSSGLAALVTAGTTDSTHRLQMTSLIQRPPVITTEGLPEFSSLDSAPSEILPACFILQLQPPLPMFSSFIDRMHQITEMAPGETDLQWMPFPWLLETSLRESSCPDPSEGEDTRFFVPLPDNQMHSYLLAGKAWGIEALKGALVHCIPFTHPAQVPALLELLRHQAAINTLLSSIIPHHRPCQGSEPDLYCEILPVSESSFSMSFLLAEPGCFGVWSVNLQDCRQITSRLAGPSSKDFSFDEYITRVLKRCMSIPLAMRALCRRLGQNSSLDASSTLTAATSEHAAAPAACSYEAGSEASAACASSVDSQTVHPGPPPAVISQNTPVTDSSCMPAPPVCSYFVMSVPAAQSAPGANTESLANPYTGGARVVLQSWSASNPLGI